MLLRSASPAYGYIYCTIGCAAFPVALHLALDVNALLLVCAHMRCMYSAYLMARYMLLHAGCRAADTSSPYVQLHSIAPSCSQPSFRRCDAGAVCALLRDGMMLALPSASERLP